MYRCVTASHIAVGAAHSHYAAPIFSRGVSRQSSIEEPENFQSTFRKQLSAQSDSQENPKKIQKPASRSSTDSPVKCASEEQQRTPNRARQDSQDSGKDEPAEDEASREASLQQPTNGSKKGSRGVQRDGDSAERLVENAQPGFLEPGPFPAFAASALIEDQSETEKEPPIPAKTSNVDGTSEVGSNPSKPVVGELALALRITTARQSSSDATGAEPESQEPQESVGTLVSRNQVQPIMANVSRAREAEPASIIEGAAPVDMNSSAANAHSAPTDEVAKVPAHGFEAEFTKFLNQPVKSAHVQISGVDNQRVDIRLQERGGTLSLTVRSTDTRLTQSLQDHAPELNSRLTTEHFRSEVWTPSSTKTANERDTNNGNGSATLDREKLSQQNPNRNRNSRKRPEWIEAVEAQKPIFKKRIEHTWHQ
jgi:hypothetical protein